MSVLIKLFYLIAGLLMAGDLAIPREVHEGLNRRARRILNSLAKEPEEPVSIYSLSAAFLATFVFALSVMAHGLSEDVAGERFPASRLAIGASLILVGVGLGGMAAIGAKLALVRLTTKRWGDYILTLLFLVVPTTSIFIPVIVLKLTSPLLDLPAGFAFGTASLWLFLMIVRPVGRWLNYENKVFLRFGLLVFIITAAVDLFWG
jgi:hypothetical protein